MTRDEVLGAALAAIAQKERTVSEMVQLLERRGAETAVALDVVEELVADETLDDARFARLFAEDKRSISGWGADRIREALVRRGVDYSDLEQALAEDGEDELVRATALVTERGFELGSEKDRGKALGLLARRGFDSDVAYGAIRRAEREALEGRY